MPRTYTDRAQPRRQAVCSRRCRVVRCSALVFKEGRLQQCCLCVRPPFEHCHHHRGPGLVARATLQKRRFRDPRQFTLGRRYDPTVKDRRLAVVGDGVAIRRSGIELKGSRVPFMGLWALWDFAQGDMITIYDGLVTMADERDIPDAYKSHVQTLGRGAGKALRRILGYKSDGAPQIRPGHGAASIVSSTSGTGLRPNARLDVMDLYPEIIYPARSFAGAGPPSAHAPMAVLVATQDIRRGQEILRAYDVR